MIRIFLLQPLGPALILALGGLMLWLVSWLSWRYALGRRRAAIRWFRLPLALLILAAAIWVWLRVAVTPSAHDLTWRWQPLTVAGAPFLWRMDAWNGLATLLLLLLATALVLLDEDEPTEGTTAGSLERTLWLAAAASTFVCSANMLTVASSWLALDVLLAVRLHPGHQKEPAGRAWSLLLMVAPLLLLVLVTLGEAGLPATLVGGRFGRQELSLLWLLGLIRTGIYPFHFWLTAPGHVRAPASTAVHLLGPAAGIWFLARVQALAGVGLTRRPEWVALGVLALLGSAMAAWLAERDVWRWRWIAVNRGGVVLLAAYVSAVPGPAAFVWPLVTFGLGGALLATGLRLRERGHLLRWPTLLGALVLWGAPGTVGFLARSALIFPTELPLAAPLFSVVLVGEVLLVATLWESVRRASDEATRPGTAAPTWSALVRIGLATALLAGPALGWGLFPQRLAELGGFPLPNDSQNLAQLISASRRSVWIGLLLSGLLGSALGIWRQRLLGQMRGWQQIIGQIVGLEWLYRGAVAGLRLIGGGLYYFATLGEGAGYLGWLALAGLILWVLIRG
ncbi:MAG: hypothetical protein WHX53_06720 [Anaerolineae bacterium]